jgi:predicted short-subunit dehydrogenase-like oxidoreductase (DUF2520 family)
VAPDREAAVIHLAGSLGLDVLDPHPRVGSVHPLVALPSPELGAARLAGGAWFAVAGDPITRAVVDALGGRAFEVADEARVLYHAAACIASNHTVALLGQVERLAQAVGVPFDAYLELAQGSLDNAARLGPRRAITGPAARGDAATLARHLAALPDDERAAYALMADECRRLAEG